MTSAIANFKFSFPQLKNSKRVKTPTVLQMEAVECGAAALGIILGYYRLIVPLPKLRQACGVSRDGSKASNVLKAARNYGMKAKGFKMQLEALKELSCPYIVFWNFNHFLVVEGFVGNRVYLNDPATGPRSVSLQEFDEAYTGVVLVIEPGEEFTPGGKKASIISALTTRLQSSQVAIIYSVIAGFLLVIPGLVIPVFTQVFVDEILVQGQQDWLMPLLIGMVVTALLRGLLKQLQLQSLRRLRLKLSVGMSSRFLWHILQLPTQFYAQRFAGEISNRVSINDQVAEVLSGRLATTLIDLVVVVLYTLVMFLYDWRLTLIGIFFALLNVATLQWVSRQRVDTNLRLVQESGKASGVAIAGLQSMETLKASALESDFFARWAGYYTKSINAQQDLGLTNQVLSLLPFLLNSLTTILILVVGGFRVMSGFLSIGMLVAFQSLMQSFLEPVNSLVDFGSTLQELEGDLNRLDDVLNNPIDEQLQVTSESQTSSSQPANLVKLQGYVELRDISFGYTQVEAPLLSDFNFSLQPGQRVALVGGSGSGKSTVAKLVSGLYQPWGGEILFDGKPRSQWQRSILSNSVAMVEQDILMFEGSVRDNLTLWDVTVPDQSLVKACRDAAIHEVIMALPGGYDGQLAEGATNLSGGQRQRLEIARALVNNPSILIMDEATSALDAETEKIIDQNLRLRGCSCIIVAHRLSTIRDCDEIIVLDRGQVVQRGTHDELKQQEGLYSLLISEGS